MSLSSWSLQVHPVVGLLKGVLAHTEISCMSQHWTSTVPYWVIILIASKLGSNHTAPALLQVLFFFFIDDQVIPGCDIALQVVWSPVETLARDIANPLPPSKLSWWRGCRQLIRPTARTVNGELRLPWTANCHSYPEQRWTPSGHLESGMYCYIARPDIIWLAALKSIQSAVVYGTYMLAVPNI